MKKYKGSYTVEASMVMPFLIVIFCVILYGIFYIHDLCVIKIYTARAAQECSWAAVENAASLVPRMRIVFYLIFIRSIIKSCVDKC